MCVNVKRWKGWLVELANLVEQPILPEDFMIANSEIV